MEYAVSENATETLRTGQFISFELYKNIPIGK